MGTWVNSQQWSALHPQPWSQWSSADPRAVLTQKGEVFWKAETRQCVENALGRLTLSCPALGAEPREGGAQGQCPGSRVLAGGWRREGPIHLLLVATGPHMLDYASPLQRVEQNWRSVFQTRVCYCSGKFGILRGFSCYCSISDAFGSDLEKPLSVAYMLQDVIALPKLGVPRAPLSLLGTCSCVLMPGGWLPHPCGRLPCPCRQRSRQSPVGESAASPWFRAFYFLIGCVLGCAESLLWHSKSVSCGVWDLSLTRDRTRVPCTGSTESYPLDYQGSPCGFFIIRNFQTCSEALSSCCIGGRVSDAVVLGM